MFVAHAPFAEHADPEYRASVNQTRQTVLSVLNVTYNVKQWVGPWWKGACFRRQMRKLVLDDLTLHLKSGEITAILGNSGSGKTSLLDVIACRASGRRKGNVFYNNMVVTPLLIKQRATYVMQADRLLPNLTVRETLRYTARLQLAGSAGMKEINRKVDCVIQQMGLKDVADSRIGGSIIRGISGGEKRRVTIAIQILKDPEIILLDEPTSGLDSYTARYLVANLRDLARSGKVVLLTIHQPSSDMLPMFDQVGIMSMGSLVYLGPTREMVPYFTRHGFPCDKYTNPLDRYVDVASIDRRDRDREAESFLRVSGLIESFRNSELYQDTLKEVLDVTSRPSTRTASVYIPRGRGASLPKVIATMLSRMNVNLFRDRKDYLARIVLLPLFIVFILMFLGHLQHTQSSIQDRMGLLYQSITVPVFIGIINSIALFPSQRDLYYRENRDGLYSTSTFIVTYSLHIIPFHIVSSIIFSSIVYWGIGMYPEAERFGKYIVVVLLLHYWGEMFAAMLMGLVLDPNFANTTAALVVSASVLVSSGYLKDPNSLLSPLQWLNWAQNFKYAGELYAANELAGLQLTCDLTRPNGTCIPTGDVYMDKYFPNAVENMGRNFAALAAFDVATMILTIVAFKLRGVRHLN